MLKNVFVIRELIWMWLILVFFDGCVMIVFLVFFVNELDGSKMDYKDLFFFGILVSGWEK